MPRPNAFVVASGLLALLAAAPAGASPCADQISALETRLGSPGAAMAEITAEARGPGAAPAQAGTAGAPDRFAAARQALGRARALDGRGDNAGCNDALTEAKGALGPLP